MFIGYSECLHSLGLYFSLFTSNEGKKQTRFPEWLLSLLPRWFGLRRRRNILKGYCIPWVLKLGRLKFKMIYACFPSLSVWLFGGLLPVAFVAWFRFGLASCFACGLTLDYMGRCVSLGLLVCRVVRRYWAICVCLLAVRLDLLARVCVRIRSGVSGWIVDGV